MHRHCPSIDLESNINHTEVSDISANYAAMASCTWIRKGLDIAKLPRVRLNNIQDLPGAKKKAVRVGRGPGSGRGKTCGRGHKGQGQRNKKRVRVGFEGGQTPFYLTVPKRGFKNKFQIEYEPLNLNRLQYLIDGGRIDASQPITMHTLHKAGAVGKIKHGVKLLADGADWFSHKVNIEVSKASKSAITAVEGRGGSIVTAHYNQLGLRVLLKPEAFAGRPLPRRALPNKKLMPYYLNPENRGYLAVTEAGKQRMKEAGISGAYLGPDGRVHIPGKRVTLYSDPSPPLEDCQQTGETQCGRSGPTAGSDANSEDLETPV